LRRRRFAGVAEQRCHDVLADVLSGLLFEQHAEQSRDEAGNAAIYGVADHPREIADGVAGDPTIDRRDAREMLERVDDVQEVVELESLLGPDMGLGLRYRQTRSEYQVSIDLVFDDDCSCPSSPERLGQGRRLSSRTVCDERQEEPGHGPLSRMTLINWKNSSAALAHDLPWHVAHSSTT
jgi:hypothetical protein